MKKAFIFLVLCVLILGAFFWRESRKKETVKISSESSAQVFENGELNARAAYAKWKEVIKKQGPDKAKAVFKSDLTVSNNTGSQHLAAHVWGKVLYEQAGIDGLTVCDSDFGFGCYHSFFGAAVADQGKDIIPKLDAICVKTYGGLGTGCQHGIGHGILEFLGHDKLQEALEVCRLTTQNNFLFGCSSGVFMEYNTPILVSETSATSESRSFNDFTDASAPCENLKDEGWRRSCYYELPGLLLAKYNTREISKFCAGLKSSQEQQACWLGLGNQVAARNTFSPEVASKECKSVSSGNGRVYCSAGAAWMLNSMPEFRSQAAGVCGSLSANESAQCLEKANLICSYLKDSSQTPMCEQSNPFGKL